jgi:GTP-binding protein HflX
MAGDLARPARESGRQVGVMPARDGALQMVLAGDPRSITFPDLPKSRGGRWRFRRLQFAHTHIKGDPLIQDDLMELVLVPLECMAAVRMDPHGTARDLEVAHILPAQGGQRPAWEILPLMSCAEPEFHFSRFIQSSDHRGRLADPAAAPGPSQAPHRQGKTGGIIARALECGVALLIFSHDLNPSQVRTITDIGDPLGAPRPFVL